MGGNKKYAGYKSYQYLTPDEDYTEFKLVPEIGRVKPFVLPLNDKEEKRVKRLLDSCVVISLHEHPRILPDDLRQLADYNRQGREWTGYEGLSVSGMDAVFDNLLDGSCIITSKMGWKWNDVIHDIGMKLSDIAHQTFVIRGETTADIEKAYTEGKVALIPALESATPIENEVDRIDVLYGLGVRMMGLVYSEANSLGSGVREDGDGGLTKFGYEVVKRMNKMGMAIDTAHVGDRTSLDAIKASTKPTFISHVGARALWGIKRMKPDEVLIACAKRGGVIGIEAAPDTTMTHEIRKLCIDSVMAHFKYIVELVGIDHVGFGLDVNFGDHVGLHHIFSHFLSIKEAFGGEEYEEVEYVEGLENPSEFPNVVRWLVKHGYSDNEIAKVVGGNMMGALKEVWYK